MPGRGKEKQRGATINDRGWMNLTPPSLDSFLNGHVYNDADKLLLNSWIFRRLKFHR